MPTQQVSVLSRPAERPKDDSTRRCVTLCCPGVSIRCGCPPAGHRRAPYSSTMDSRNTGDEQQRASEPDNISGATGEAPFGGDDRGDGVVIPADFGAGSSGRGGDRFPSVEPDLSSSVDDVVFEDSVIELTRSTVDGDIV